MKPKFTDEHKWAVPYVPSSATDITKAFKRERERIKAQAEERVRVVTPIAKVRK